MSHQIKILIVAESIDVEDSSASKGRVALIRNLHKAGFNVQVYHYTRKNIKLDSIPCFAIKENRSSVFFVLSRLERVFRKKLKFHLNKPLEKIFGFSFTLFNDRNSIISALESVEDFDPDFVLTLSKGGSFRPHHALLKIPRWQDKWMAYIHDPYPMHLYPRPYAWVEAGYLPKWRFVMEMSKKAAYPIFPSQLLKEWMGSYFNGYLEKGIIIPHQINNVDFENYPDLPEFFDPDKFNILHAGNLLHARDPRGLIDAFTRFVNKDELRSNEARLHFIGPTEFFKETLESSAKQVTQIVLNTKHFDFEAVRLLQNKASINVILEAKSEISPFLPGKFPHCVAANKPILVLGPYLSETRRLLGKEYPYWAEIDDVGKIQIQLELLYSKWKENKGLLDRPDLEYYLSPEFLKEKISEIFQNK